MAVFRLCVPLHAHMHTEIMELETIIKVFYYSRATFPPKAPLLHNLFMEEPANPASAQTQIHAHTHTIKHTQRPQCPVFLHIGTIWKITHVFLGSASTEASW